MAICFSGLTWEVGSLAEIAICPGKNRLIAC